MEGITIQIYIDADACPVKQEVYRVARRYHVPVTLVANTFMRIPSEPGFSLKIVKDNPDEADNHIVESVQKNDMVITADIPLADRCIKAHARVLTPTGKEFTEENIGGALAMRDLMSELRSNGVVTGGPAPFSQRDRSRFLQQLDRILVALTKT